VQAPTTHKAPATSDVRTRNGNGFKQGFMPPLAQRSSRRVGPSYATAASSRNHAAVGVNAGAGPAVEPLLGRPLASNANLRAARLQASEVVILHAPLLNPATQHPAPASCDASSQQLAWHRQLIASSSNLSRARWSRDELTFGLRWRPRGTHSRSGQSHAERRATPR